MIITIDGPAGSGKSTIAKLLAKELHLEYLDTGAMYRSVALLGLRRNVDWNKPGELVELARNCRIESRSGRTFLDSEDVSELVRSQEVTAHTKYAAGNPEVRALLVPIQRAIAEKSVTQSCRGVVAEGRDQGTVVFPDADRKIYLTASPEERAKRRLGELEKRGEHADVNLLLEQINTRDAEDMTRKFAPLCVPEGAWVFSTDGLSIEQVLAKLVEFVSFRLPYALPLG